MKKLLTKTHIFFFSLLILFMAQGAWAGDLGKRFAVSQEYDIQSNMAYTIDTYYLIRDKETGIRYLVVKSHPQGCNSSYAGIGIAITKLEKGKK